MLKRLKLSDGGITRLSILFMLVMVFIYNLTDQIIKEQDIFERCIYTVPFLLFFIFFLLIKHPILNTIFLFFIGFYITFSNGFSGGLGLGFFILGYYSFKNTKTLIFILILTLLSLSFRILMLEDSIPSVLLDILCAAFFYILWYDLVYLRYEKKSSISKNISQEENKILTLMSQGYSQKCAGAEMGLSQSEASELIKKVKRKTGYESLYQIMALYGVPK